MNTKQQIIDEVCIHLGIPSFQLSTGSTEPKEFLVSIIEQLGLEALAEGEDKIQLGKLVVEASGSPWLPEYDSTGSTITREGLLAIQRAVNQLIR